MIEKEEFVKEAPAPAAVATRDVNHDSSLRIGQLRFESDKRQLGGLLMLLGVTALVFPMANVATLVGPDGTTASEGIALSSLIAGLFVIIMGLVAVPLGYLQTVHDYSNPKLTTALIIWTQLAWMPFLTDLTGAGKMARSGEAFIPGLYDPTPGDVKFVGAMGMMGILGYGTGFLGSLAFVEFSLLAFQSNKPTDRTGSYYRGRMAMYTFCNFLVGTSQLMLGVYVLSNFGSGPLPNGPINVAMYVVHFPEISIAVGCIQTLNALFGLLRSCGIARENSWYQTTTLVQWVATVTLQILVQIAYAPGGMAAPAAPSQTMLTLGLSAICAFLDYKGRTTPDDLANSYYGLPEQALPTTEDGDESESHQHEPQQDEDVAASQHQEEVDDEEEGQNISKKRISARPPPRKQLVAVNGDWDSEEEAQ